MPKDTHLKRLEDLLADVPHLSYDALKDTSPELLRELEKHDGDAYPTHFLTADDIDNYLHEIDTRLDPDTHVPTLAPIAHPNLHPPVHPLLKNPNSSISWLQRKKPSIFNHEPETHDDNAAATGTDKEAQGGTSTRKPRGGRGERSGKASRPSKRTSAIKAAAAADKGGDWDASMDEDPDFASTPVPKGKRKRAAVDDDAGYRPKSGSRPTKKKRKSEGGADGTPTVSRKSKKDAAPVDDD